MLSETDMLNIISNTMTALQVRDIYPEYYLSKFRNYSPQIEEKELFLRILSDLFTVRFYFNDFDDPCFDSCSIFYIKSCTFKAMGKFDHLYQRGLSYSDRVASGLHVGLDWLYATNLYGEAMDVEFLKLHGIPYALRIKVCCYSYYSVIVECILAFFKALDEAYRRWFCA